MLDPGLNEIAALEFSPKGDQLAMSFQSGQKNKQIFLVRGLNEIFKSETRAVENRDIVKSTLDIERKSGAISFSFTNSGE